MTPAGKPPKLTAKWARNRVDYNPDLGEFGDLTFTHPDRDGAIVSRILSRALPDQVLLEIKKAGYDLKTLRISIAKRGPA